MEIIQLNLESLRDEQYDSLIVIDIETFKMGLKELGKLEHYEDCSLMVKHIDKFVIDEEIYFKLYKQVLGITSHINI